MGAFAVVLASLREFYGFMDEVVSERYAWAAENVATVKNYQARTISKEGLEQKIEKVQMQ